MAKKKATGQGLKAVKSTGFIRKIDPKILADYVKKHPDHIIKDQGRKYFFPFAEEYCHLFT